MSHPTVAARMMHAGHVVQVVYYETGAYLQSATQIIHDDTIPQSGEGAEWATIPITPKSISNKLLIEVSLWLASGPGVGTVVALFQDSLSNALAVSSDTVPGSNYRSNMVLRHFMTAGTISSTTFKVRVGTADGSTYGINGWSGVRQFGGSAASSVSIMEIAA